MGYRKFTQERRQALFLVEYGFLKVRLPSHSDRIADITEGRSSRQLQTSRCVALGPDGTTPDIRSKPFCKLSDPSEVSRLRLQELSEDFQRRVGDVVLRPLGIGFGVLCRETFQLLGRK